MGGGVVAELDVGRPVGDEDVGDADVEDLEDVGDADVVVAVLLGQPVGDVEVVAVELAEVVAELVDELLPPPRIEVRIEVGIGPGELLDVVGQLEAVAAGVAATAAVPVPVIATVAATPAIPASAMPDDPMTTRADRLRRCSG